MGNERYPRGTDPQDGYYNRSNPQDYGRDYGSGSAFSYSGARDYRAAGAMNDRDEDRGRDQYGRDTDRQGGTGMRDRSSYGANVGGTGRGGYDRQDNLGSGGDYGSRGADDDWRGNRSYGGRGQMGGGSMGGQNYGRIQAGGRDMNERDYGQRSDYTSDSGYGRQGGSGADYGRQPQGYNYQERGFVARAGDEVRSWFGDDDAERRRQMDQRYDERQGADRNAGGSYGRDADYHDWRHQQIRALDRDYDEYRNENRSRFHTEFGNWRKERETQRNALNQVAEHMEVLGSDGQHVGTVDKVRGDRIILTKNDKDAGGHHHSIPSRWIQSVAEAVTISKSAADAHAHWKDEERNQAFFADNADERHAPGQTDRDSTTRTDETDRTGDSVRG